MKNINVYYVLKRQISNDEYAIYIYFKLQLFTNNKLQLTVAAR